MASYETLRNHQTELIRKALKGSLFLANEDADPIVSLTTYVAGPPPVISLSPLGTGWDDAGLLNSDGISTSNDVSNSEVTSWGYVSPTRSDIETDTTTFTATMQETKLLTIGLYTGIDVAGVTPTANTGEVRLVKPGRPSSRYYRGLILAVDDTEDGEIYVGRYFDRLKVTGKSDQSYGGGDDPITWGVTFTTYIDDDSGSAESWLFGGPGWNAKLAAMGFDTTP